MNLHHFSSSKAILLSLLFLAVGTAGFSQAPLFSGVAVSDMGNGNSIGQANTSKNVAVASDGTIYVVYSGSAGVRVAKSTDRGATFLPSLQISASVGSEPAIMVNDQGIVFVSFISNGLFISRSLDQGESFEEPRGVSNSSFGAAHMAHYNNNVYLTDTSGRFLISNSNQGIGDYTITPTGRSFVYSDVFTDVNGNVFLPTDDPNLYLFVSTDNGNTVNEITLNPPGEVFFSSYALSDGPCGTYIFTGGAGSAGYRLDVETGMTLPIALAENSRNVQGRTLFADNTGTLIDGYQAGNGELQMKISADQGTTFSDPVIIATGESHNIARNPFTDDIVAVYSQDGQIFLSVYPDLLKNIRLNEFETPPDFCDSNSFDIEFELFGTFTSSSLFEVILSDEQGDFSNAVIIGSDQTATGGTVNCTIPDGIELSSDYRILIKSDEICLQSNTLDLIIDNTLQITGSTAICEMETTQLSGSGVPSSTLPWTSSDESVATVDNNGLVTGITAGTTVITYFEEGGCEGNVSIDLTVSTQPAINGPEIVCFDSQAIFTAGGSPSTTDPWISSDPAVATIDQSGLLTAISVGTTMVTYTTQAGCTDTILVDIAADASITGENVLCLNETSQLSTVALPSPGDMWQSLDPSIASVNGVGLVTSNAPGTTTITFTNAIGCNGSIDITVTEHIVIETPDNVCENQQLQLIFSGGSSALQWSSSDTSIASVDEDGLVSGFIAGSTLITAVDDNGCSTDVVVTVDPLPEFNLPDTVIVCTDEDGNVILETPILESGLDAAAHSFQWFYNNDLINNETASSIEVIFSGEYRLVATSNATGCEFEDSTTAVRKEPPTLTVETTSSDFEEDQMIVATATGDGDLEFSIGDGVWQGNGVFQNLDNGRYEVTVRDRNGCGEETQVVYILSYPKFFTPNNDGFNDLWRISGLQENQDASIYIFDRYGKLLKQLNSTDPSWDGTFIGELMPSSDYWFRINYIPIGADAPRDFRAHFTLKR